MAASLFASSKASEQKPGILWNIFEPALPRNDLEESSWENLWEIEWNKSVKNWEQSHDIRLKWKLLGKTSLTL